MERRLDGFGWHLRHILSKTVTGLREGRAEPSPYTQEMDACALRAAYPLCGFRSVAPCKPQLAGTLEANRSAPVIGAKKATCRRIPGSIEHDWKVHSQEGPMIPKATNVLPTKGPLLPLFPKEK